MRSRVWLRNGLLMERLGPCTFGYRLVRIGKELAWTVERARVFGIIPLPASMFDGVRCRESEDEAGRYRFSVEARLPVIGLLIRYEGWLQYAAALGNGIASYELAVFYRRQGQPTPAAQYETRARDLGYTPPTSLDNQRK